MGNNNLTEREFNRQMAKVKKENAQKERRLILQRERSKYDRPKVETSKLIAVYLFALLNAIVIYAMVAMWRFADFSYLGVLISDIAAQVIIYAIYCMKAFHAKKESERMKFDREKLTGSIDDILDAGSESEEYVPLTTGSVELPDSNDDAVG